MIPNIASPSRNVEAIRADLNSSAFENYSNPYTASIGPNTDTPVNITVAGIHNFPCILAGGAI